MGGIEEKIYRRQIYKKKGIHRQTIEGKEEKTDSTALSKYFDNSNLFELFKCDFTDKCETLDLLLARDGFPI